MMVLTSVMNCLRKCSAVLCIFVLLMAACKQQEKKEEEATVTVTASLTPFITPPIKSADVPYKEYEVDAAKGDTLIYPTGSIIRLQKLHRP